MPSDLPALLGDLITVNHRLTRVAAHAADSRESPAVWRTLSVLRQLGPIRLGEIAARSRISQPTATKLVAHLVERGWAARLADPLDARVTSTVITAAGDAALSAWRSELAEALLPMFDGLADAELATIRNAATACANASTGSEVPVERVTTAAVTTARVPASEPGRPAGARA
ncbi:MarR family winged helix-turn-helix transcriptional regulator [Cryobacterium sp. 10C3]|uniref:MarR family winged helix-turn-helix transcriptional regulator n=1 Tax=Cryobacterium sp. 10C3 TaxID=3048577 RepID=UPI002AB4CF4C|nr:MarR family transcriptional regulator [Cryobacterium sp. 10C3]MDY7558557.1 MarR family transcriptional regulator [Cryobacterium sp. 10C3]